MGYGPGRARFIGPGNPAPGLISGMLLGTARVPAGVAGTAPVVFLAGGVASQTGVTIEVTPPAQELS